VKLVFFSWLCLVRCYNSILKVRIIVLQETALQGNKYPIYMKTRIFKKKIVNYLFIFAFFYGCVWFLVNEREKKRNLWFCLVRWYYLILQVGIILCCRKLLCSEINIKLFIYIFAIIIDFFLLFFFFFFFHFRPVWILGMCWEREDIWDALMSITGKPVYPLVVWLLHGIIRF